MAQALRGWARVAGTLRGERRGPAPSGFFYPESLAPQHGLLAGPVGVHSVESRAPERRVAKVGQLLAAGRPRRMASPVVPVRNDVGGRLACSTSSRPSTQIRIVTTLIPSGGPRRAYPTRGAPYRARRAGLGRQDPRSRGSGLLPQLRPRPPHRCPTEALSRDAHNTRTVLYERGDWKILAPGRIRSRRPRRLAAHGDSCHGRSART